MLGEFVGGHGWWQGKGHPLHSHEGFWEAIIVANLAHDNKFLSEVNSFINFRSILLM